MKNKWIWALGIALAFIAITAVPFLFEFFLPNGGYGMMRYGYGWHMPMMYGGFNMMGFGMMLFMWLISFTSLVLIGLAIAWFVRELNKPKA